jgi:LmbE family N-acetylglucosaminyl deacetylase
LTNNRRVKTPILQVSTSDRILFFAVHPDDETLGGGGLLQQAARAAANVRVVFVTDGERNPWPQRVLERRWTISLPEQQRWAGRRRGEAFAALAKLGLDAEVARFLGWPDQALTELLLRADHRVIATICREVEEFRPTLLVFPSASDAHPDHSAVHVLVKLAAAQQSADGHYYPQLTYVVHQPQHALANHTVSVLLNEKEVETKRRAIECHESQMLSRRRFLAYATRSEKFYALTPQAAHPQHPIRAARIERGALRLTLKLPLAARLFTPTLYLALESLPEGGLRWILPLPHHSSRVRFVQQQRRGEAGRFATVRLKGLWAQVAVPISTVQPLAVVFAKLDWRPLFFDWAGWREIPVIPGSPNDFALRSPERAISNGSAVHLAANDRPKGNLTLPQQSVPNPTDASTAPVPSWNLEPLVRRGPSVSE